MKSLFYLLILSLCLMSCGKNSSVNKWAWAKNGGGPNYDGARDLGTDSEGNVYVLGRFQGKGNIGDTPLNGNGDDEIFLAKYDAEGKLIWAKTAGGTSEDAGYGMAVTSDGTCYINGFFSGEAKFDGITITSNGKTDIFLAAYDKDGKVLWAKGYGSPNNDNGRDLSIDKDGNVYMTGFFMGNMKMDSVNVTAYDFYEDIFISKMDKNGNVIWAQSAGKNKSNDRGNTIANDSEGNVIIAGYFTRNAFFGTDSVSGSDQAEIFIAKYDNAGNYKWVREAGGYGWDEGMALTTTKQNDAVLTGFFTKAASFDTLETGAVKGFGERDVFTALYDKDGKFNWVKIGGGVVVDEPRAISTTDANEILVTGFYGDTASFDTMKVKTTGEYDVFVLKYDLKGDLKSAESIGGAKYDEGRAILPIKQGYFLAGGFNEKLILDDSEITPIGDFDFFVTKRN